MSGSQRPSRRTDESVRVTLRIGKNAGNIGAARTISEGTVILQLKCRLGEIDPKQEIVAYCRGPYCVLSYEAVAQLRARGFKVRRLEDGLPEWRAAGLPVVTGNA
jgi:rhodanese-related sulfurtransferase